MAVNFGPLPELPEPQPEKEIPRDIVAEPLTAWRMWQVTRPQEVKLTPALVTELADRFDRGDNPFRSIFGARLQGVGYAFPWDTSDITAVCTRQNNNPYSITLSFSSSWASSASIAPTPPKHEAPHRNCQCGVWALKSTDDLWAQMDQYNKTGEHVFAYGRVQMWGRIYEHDKGFRAQHARPYELNVINGDDSHVRELRDFYRCDVQSVEAPQEVTAAREARLRQEALERKREHDLWRIQWDSLSSFSHSRMLELPPPPKKSWWKP